MSGWPRTESIPPIRCDAALKTSSVTCSAPSWDVSPIKPAPQDFYAPRASRSGRGPTLVKRGVSLCAKGTGDAQQDLRWSSSDSCREIERLEAMRPRFAS